MILRVLVVGSLPSVPVKLEENSLVWKKNQLGILVNTSWKIPIHRDFEMQAAYSIVLQPLSALAAYSIGTEREEST